MTTVAAAAPASAAPPAISGVLALAAVSATALPADLVLSIAVSLIASVPFRLCADVRDLDREGDAPDLFARLAFESLELEPFDLVPAVDRFDVAPLRAAEEREPLRRVVLCLRDVFAFVLA